MKIAAFFFRTGVLDALEACDVVGSTAANEFDLKSTFGTTFTGQVHWGEFCHDDSYALR